MQEVYELQANAVAVRLVQAVPQLQVGGMPIPSGPGVGAQVPVLGTNYVPSWVGINGPHGWSEGTLELRLYEEGAFTLKLPNAAGEDGVLHRERFLILNTGRPTPSGGPVTSYGGGQFRPGDEFVEIYRTTATGAPGQLLFVGAITRSTIDPGQIQLEGSDGLWLLKKTRETAAGFFVNSPRDVIEHYTRVKRAVVADDFPQDGRFQYTGGNVQTTADGQWAYDHVWNNPPSSANQGASTWSSALGTALRMGVAGRGGAIRGQVGVPAAFMQQPDAVVRLDVGFRWVPGYNANDAIIIGLGQNANANSSSAEAAASGAALALIPATNSLGPPGTTYLVNGSGGSQQGTQAQGFIATAWHTLSLEIRDRYIFGYLDGKLVAVIPALGAVDPVGSLVSSVVPWVGTGYTASAGHCLVDIDYVVCRAWLPGMLRPVNVANLGDYSIGGVPAAGSCLMEVWRADDSPPFGMEFAPSRAGSGGVGFTGKYSVPSPVLPAVYNGGGSPVPAWWPASAGSWSQGRWAARLTGSMYLTLGTYDYRFRILAGEARLWVGKTRFGEQLIDAWSTTVRTINDPATRSPLISPTLRGLTPVPPDTLNANAGSGTNGISTATGFGNNNGQLLRIGSVAPFEYAYMSDYPFGVLRDNLARNHFTGEQVAIMNQGSLAGQPSGWYPFITEFNYISGLAHSFNNYQLQYERSDQPGWWVNVGAAPYGHAVYAAVGPGNPNGVTLTTYWPLNEGYYIHNATNYSSIGSATPTTTIVAGDSGAISQTTGTLLQGDAAPVFNGGVNPGRTGDYLVTSGANVPISTSSWTISAIAQPTSLTGIQEIFRKNSALAIRFNGTNVEVIASTGAGDATMSFGVSAVVGTWYHLVATWDGSNVRLYVNGVLFGTDSFPGPQVSNTNPVYFASQNGGSEWFSGALGHVFIASGVLSASAVAALYAGATAAPHVPVSPSGIVDTSQQPYRYVSHYDQLIQTVKDWGLQITAEPMQLESGEFPARLRPRLRVGRSTEYVVGSPQVKRSTSADISDAITAEEVADALAADAQGLSDPTGGSSVTAEVFNFPGIIGPPTPGASPVPLHAWLSEEYDQSNDVAYPALLFQRLLAQLALHGAPWEQVSMTSTPERQLVDTFPLSGAAAEFFWLPGDGVRLNFIELGVVDVSTRQILGVQWPITPGGLGAPSISLRQRPRSFGTVLRDMFRQTLSARRQYQGQLVLASGNVASGVGQISAVMLPNNLQNIVSATLVVYTKSDSSAWTIQANGTSTGITVTQIGRYDLSGWVSRLNNATAMQAALSGGTGTWSFVLEVLMRV